MRPRPFSSPRALGGGARFRRRSAGWRCPHGGSGGGRGRPVARVPLAAVEGFPTNLDGVFCSAREALRDIGPSIADLALVSFFA